MKKNRKAIKTAAVLLTMVLLVTFGVSCQKQGTGRTAEAPKTVDYSEHETFTTWLYADPYDEYSDYSDNPVVWALNRKFNVTLKFEQPVQGTESDSLSLMFGTGEYTDMIEMSQYTGSLPRLYEDGVIIDIAEYLDYMPNFRKLLETNEGYRRTSYDDNGRIFTLRGVYHPEAPELLWGGLLYRRDILESVTDGKVRFPSGNDYPKTIDDWEYMLPLYKSYFESRGAADYAPLIIPYNGYFGAWGELVNSFGGRHTFYLDGSTVKYGPQEEPFYKYLKKMREWYEKGYIYKDFASRVNDMFFLPNPALTYGGNAGIWLGIKTQEGTQMSNPQYGLNFDVRPLPSPLSTADGVTEFSNFQRNPTDGSSSTGWAFTRKCENLPKLLSIMDYLYSEEGMWLRHGLTKETGSAENPIYVKAGLQDGFYWFEGDKLVVNPLTTNLKNGNAFSATAFRVLRARMFTRRNRGVSLWSRYGIRILTPNTPNCPDRPGQVPAETEEEEAVYSPANVRITDYINSTVPKFIMGTQPLNDQTWAEFKTQLKNLGIEEQIRIQQAAYDRYLKR
jgi:putative aldouronate transport system substrate-binding protein